MKKKLTILISSLLLATVGCVTPGDVAGGSIGGGGSGGDKLMERGAYLALGNDIVAKYAILQASLLELGAAHLEATGQNEKAAELRDQAKFIKDDPTEENITEGSQIANDLAETLSSNEAQAAKYTEAGKDIMRKAWGSRLTALASGAMIVKDIADWGKEFKDQLKGAGFQGASKFKQDTAAAVYVLKNAAKDVPNYMKLKKRIKEIAKANNVDLEELKNRADKTELD